MSAYTSWVDVANAAIIDLGANPIIGFSDTTKEARLTSVRYPVARDAVLRMCPWKSVSSRVVLAASTTKPAFNYLYAYPVPTDFIRLIEIYPLDTSWKVEGRNILSSNSTMNLRYVSNAYDITVYDPLLAEAIAAYLCWKIAFNMTQSQQVSDDKFKLFQNALETARAVDGKEQSTEAMQATYFTQSRLAGTVFGTPFNPSEE